MWVHRPADSRMSTPLTERRSGRADKRQSLLSPTGAGRYSTIFASNSRSCRMKSPGVFTLIDPEMGA